MFHIQPIERIPLKISSRIIPICTVLFFFLVSSQAFAQNCSVNAGVPETICENNTGFRLSGAAAGSIQGGTTWSQVAGPSVIIDDPADLNTSLTGLLGGNDYTFRLSADCTDGSTQFQDVVITVAPITVADAGSNLESCPDSSGSLIINGNSPTNPGETGTWSIEGANNAGVTINFINSPSSTIDLSETSAGTSTLRWTITGPDYAPGQFCESFSEITVTNYGGEAIVDAGPDQSLDNCYTVNQSTLLNASFGGNNVNGQQGTWTFVSGPSTPTLSNPNNNRSSLGALIEGTYVMRWSVNGPCVNGSDTVTITVDPATQDITTATVAQRSIRFCDPTITTVTLEGADPQYAGETVSWTQTAGPGGATILDDDNGTTQVTGLNGSSTYRFLYTITNSNTGCDDSEEVTVQYSNDPITIQANGGNDIIADCGVTRVNVPFTTTGEGGNSYSIVSGPSGSTVVDPSRFQNTNSPARIDFDLEGTYTVSFRRRVAGSVQTGCNEGTDAINITVSRTPTAANAGTGQNLACDVVSTSVTGNSVGVGNSLWSQVSGPNTADIASPYAQTTTISNFIPGTYVFRYAITGGNSCTPPAESDVQIVVASSAAVSADAGTDQTICFGAPTTLDSNSPPSSNLAGTWSVDSAPPGATIVFEDENDPNSLVSGLDLPNETYILRWTIENPNDNTCPPPGSDTVTISTSGTAGPTTANAGTDQCLPSGTGTVPLSGNAPAADENGLWTVVPNNGGLTFADDTVFNTTATINTEDSYILTWTINKNAPGCQASSDDVEITVGAPAAADAGPDQSACSDVFTMSATSSTGDGLWTLVSGSGGFTIDDDTSPTAQFTFTFSGQYVFEWAVENGSCSSDSDEVVLNVGIPATVATAGTDQTICNANTVVLDGNTFDSNTENGVWTLLSGAPNSPSIVNVNDPVTTVNNLVSGTYTFRWSITGDASCPSTFDDVVVDVFVPANAGPDQQLCEANNVLLEATFGSTGSWTQIAGPGVTEPGTAATISQTPSNSNVAEVTITPGNTYEFQFTTDYTSCPVTSDEVIVTSSQGPPIDPDAGTDQVVCTADATSITLDGNDPIAGGFDTTQPENDAFWRFADVPSGSVASFNDVNQFNTTLDNLTVPGIYILEWNFATEFCTDAADVVRVEVFEAPSNADAGTAQPNACQLDAQLNATAPTIGIGLWTITTDPSGGDIVIDSPNNPTSTLSNITTLGTYTFTWTVTNGTTFTSPSGCAPQTDTVDITFTDVPPSEPNAGPDQLFCDATQTNMDATPLAEGTGTWSQTSGPGITDPGSAATITAPNNPQALILDLEPGTYEFTWTSSNGGCSLTDTMEIQIESQPVTADAGPDQRLQEFAPVNLAAVPPTLGTGVWSQVSGPSIANFTDPTDANTSVSGVQIGTYVFEWTVTNGSCSEVSDTVEIEIVGIADLELVKSVSPSSVSTGDTVTFTIALFNNGANGTSDATGVTVLDVIPSGYSLIPGTVSNGGVYNLGDLSVTWSDLSVSNGATVNLTFDATVNTTGPYDNTAEITASDQFDPDSTPDNGVDTEDDQSTTAVVIQPNDPPTAVNDESLANTLGAAVDLDILANDTDPEGNLDPNTVDLTVPSGATNILTDVDGDTIGFEVPGEGTWEYSPATGLLEFIPEPGFTGNPTDITYTVDDTDGNTSNVANVNVEYTFDPPVANDDTNPTASEVGTDTVVDLLANDVLPDGSTPAPSDVTIDLNPANPGIDTTLNVPGEGTWTYDPATGEVTFDPEPTFTGSPTPITYELTDTDTGLSDTANVSVSYQSPPVAVDDQNLGNSLGDVVTLDILDNDTDANGNIDPNAVDLAVPAGATDIVTDIDGDVIGFTVPGEGTWEYNPITGLLEFVPEPGFTGNPTDITYTVDDTDGNTSNVANVNVEYTFDPPVANDDSNPVPTDVGANTTLDLLANDILPDGSTPLPTDVTVDLDPANPGVDTTLNVPGEGTWTYDPATGEVTFDPEPTFTGSPTPITYELTDTDTGLSDTANVSVSYQSPPVANDDDDLGNQLGDTVAVDILANDNDPDANIDPNAVDLDVPAGATDTVTDIDGDVIGFTVPGEGTWEYNPATGLLEFTPESGFTGNPTDITYTVDDTDGNTSNVANVNVEYTFDPPVANDDSNPVPTDVGANTTLDLLANDILPDGSTPLPTDVTVDLDPANPGVDTTLNVLGEGTWTYDPATGEITFDPEPTFTGSPTPITYELTDTDTGLSDTANVSVSYQSPPVANDDDDLGNQLGNTVAVDILANDNDPDANIDPNAVDLDVPVGATDTVTGIDGDVIGFTVPGEGTWEYSPVTGLLEFIPQPGFTANPTDITYTVDDTDGNTSNVANVNVEYVLDPPVANNDQSTGNTTNTNVTLDLLANDILPDGSTPLPTDVTVDLDPANPGVDTTLNVPGEGTWTYDPATGEITFDPEPGFTADPTPINYELTDTDTGLSATATVTIDYDIQLPVANPDEDLNNVPESIVSVTILTNDADPDGNLDPNSVNLTPPSGAINITVDGDGDVIGFDVPGEGNWSYDPATEEVTFDPEPGFLVDPTPITYTVDDNDGNTSNITSVTIGYQDVADLSLVKTVVDNDLTPFIGSEITFEIRVTNDGPANATGVTVTDLLPSGYDFVLFSSTTGAYNENTGIWTVGNIFSGATEILLIDVLVNGSGDYTNGAEVTASDILDIDSTPNNDVLSEDDQDEVDVVPQIVPVVDVSVTKTANTLTPDIGGQIVFTVTVTNDGPSDATDVVVTDLLTTGYDFVSAVPSVGVYEPLNGSWTVGNLPNGITENIVITADVLPNGEYTNTAELTDLAERDIDSEPANNDDTEDDQMTINPTPVLVSDLSLTKTVNNATPLVGEDVRFTINITNDGPSDAAGVVIADLLPTGYTYISSNATAGNYNETTGVWNINGTLFNSTTETLVITALVNATGVYDNVAEVVASDNVDPNATAGNNVPTEDDQDNANTVPVPIADVSLTKTVDKLVPDVGENVIFTLSVSNDGPSDATGVVITDLLPAGYNYISDDSGGTYDNATGVWTVGTVANGATTLLNITADINPNGSYINVAELTAVNEIDPDSAPNNNDLNEDDQAEQPTTPRVITDISLTKEVDNLSPSIGDQITFTITVNNDGPSDATDLVIEDLLATGYDFVSATSSAGVYDEVIGSWDIVSLVDGATETLEITVTVLANGDYTNVAELISLGTFDPDSSPDNNLNSEDDQDTVLPRPTGLADLTLTKTVDNTLANVGDTIEFIVNLSNGGDSDATGVVVSDLLPIGFTYQSHIVTAGLYNPFTGIWNTNGVIPNGTTETLVVLATVNEPTGVENEYLNTAEITASDQADPNSDADSGFEVDDFADGLPDDDEASILIVPPVVDIALTKTVSNLLPRIGEQIQFEMTATNQGDVTATTIGIEEILPRGYELILANASIGTFDAVTGFWSIEALNASETATLTLTVTVLEVDEYLNTISLAFVDQIDLNMDNDSAQATVTPSCLNIYSEFSPNGDGNNEVFQIDCISRFPNNTLKVYNRWGNIVFETRGYTNDWNGISNGRATINKGEKLPVGTYYYVLDLGDGSQPIADWLYINR